MRILGRPRRVTWCLFPPPPPPPSAANSSRERQTSRLSRLERVLGQPRALLRRQRGGFCVGMLRVRDGT